jgi:hypothetical protein
MPYLSRFDCNQCMDANCQVASDNFINGLCMKLSLFFVTKLSTTRVSFVLGTGPVPGYQPSTGLRGPIAGPVVGGWIIPSGLHLAT